MNRSLRAVVLLPALMLLPALAVGQTTAGKVDAAKLKTKLLQQTAIDGHLTNINEEEKRFSFEYNYEVKKPVAGGQAKLNAINARWQAALGKMTTGLDDLKKLQAEARAVYKAAFEFDVTPVPFELKGEKTLKVLTTVAPANKKLTSTEQAKLRTGLPITLKDLDTKQWVRIIIDKTKKPAPVKEGEAPVYPITSIIVIPPPAESDPYVIPGS